ncbi:unnamed protein product [Bursaphelenchus okinawaensis]|uniref:glutathione transferase n=1 Tax=Bursaphelenchus okinawaensis TaxID=465554 RepID=A0A811K0Z3_9BILA|nr:unnamed protein product [Bursaphelenchus okinawaensis]CAG9088456.1 unnamed protein product [Bursaphelenchus okinawaensis]
MPNYKFTYFNLRALAEPTRCCFYYAGVPFEDNRVEYKDWMSVKDSYPNKQLPLFEVDGKKLTQSGAILRFVARATGLTGKDSFEEAKADEIYHFFYDNLRAANGIILDKVNIIKSKNLEQDKKDFDHHSTTALEGYTKYLEESKSGYALPSGLTYADFVIASHFLTIRNMDEQLANKYPKVAEHYKKISAIPQLQDYFAKRPDTIN